MARVFQVDNMNCQGCARKVTAAVLTVAPDAAVNVDLASKTVAVDSDAVEPATIAIAISQAGFPARAVG
jgi:copper chaperone